MIHRITQSGWLTLILCVIYALAMSLFAPGFATSENAVNVLFAMLPLLVVAAGQTIVLMTAGIDLSATAVIAMTSVIGSGLITADNGPLANSVMATPVAVMLMLLIGTTIGLGNGVCIAVIRMPAFIVTLTSMMLFSGLAVWWTQSASIYNLSPSFLVLGKNVWVTLSIAIGVVVGIQYLLSRTLFGMQLRAVGYNSQTAKVSGVHVQWVVILAYVISGACAALAAVLITGQLETGSPVHWKNNLLDIIGATVIGGTSLYGGRGSVIWTAGGVLMLALIDNSLNLLNLSYFTILMAKGVVILVAALLDTLRHRTMGATGS
jgi:ribose/xylose/arabinose/galactoside ABC-type transport system permease subunit